MAKGRKTGGRDWKPGMEQSAGPGRPAVTPQLKQLKKLNQESLAKILNELAHASIQELAAMSKETHRSVFEMIIISILKKAYEQGDQQRVNFILDRLIGKVKDQVEHTGDGFKIIVQDYTK